MWGDEELEDWKQRLSETDTRHPFKLDSYNHVTTVAGTSEVVAPDEFGFSPLVFSGDYNDLQEGELMVVEPYKARRREIYEMQLVTVEPEAAYSRLEPGEVSSYLAGGAIVNGPDHGRYDPRRVDDRGRKEYLSQAGLIRPGRDVKIRPVPALEDFDVDLTDIAEAMGTDSELDVHTFSSSLS